MLPRLKDKLRGNESETGDEGWRCGDIIDCIYAGEGYIWESIVVTAARVILLRPRECTNGILLLFFV
jgi:hypothetical protein